MISDVADSLACDVPGDNLGKISEERVSLIPSVQTQVVIFLCNKSITCVPRNFKRIVVMQVS